VHCPIIERNPTRITSWQREYIRPEDELDDPRSLALPKITQAARSQSCGEQKMVLFPEIFLNGQRSCFTVRLCSGFPRVVVGWW
jgi:hypothetical protein